MQFSRRILCVINTSTNHDYVIVFRRNVKDSRHRQFYNYKIHQIFIDNFYVLLWLNAIYNSTRSGHRFRILLKSMKLLPQQKLTCLSWNIKMTLILLHLWISRRHHVDVFEGRSLRITMVCWHGTNKIFH
jgi:hypothetical protein